MFREFLFGNMLGVDSEDSFAAQDETRLKRIRKFLVEVRFSLLDYLILGDLQTPELVVLDR